MNMVPRVLQELESQPVGSKKSFGVDVRVIAAGKAPPSAGDGSPRTRRAEPPDR
jgi:DNA-binding NtrC family response regulator